MDDPRRRIPRTDVLLRDKRLIDAAERLGSGLVRHAVRAAQDQCRDGLLEPDEVLINALSRLPRHATSLRRVVNATGVVVHTNLGRAPLSAAAANAIGLAAGTIDLELELRTGVRGRRGAAALDALARAVPAAQDVHVVNNGAAALVLAAMVLARGREIVIARGELVEIGDGFRIPDLLSAAGAVLHEVGTTNRVNVDDYERAITADTGFVLKIHPSNFVVSGFTSSVGINELSELGVPVVADIGSGLLVPHPRLPDEPDATTALTSGASMVTASGDKLLGGPQCGLMLGRRDLIQRLRRHPLARALRVDKLTLAALEATLVGPRPPVLAVLSRSSDDLHERARVLQDALRGEAVEVDVVTTSAAVGGGGAPGVEIASAGLALPGPLGPLLRSGDPAVLGRVVDGRLVLDLIAVDPSDDGLLLRAVLAASGR
jgi:L-seryl-tRNA(Ser) seleniumtransferase